MRSTLLWIAFMAFFINVNAQRNCGAMQNYNDPAQIAAAKARVASLASSGTNSLTQPLITIDIVFHVLDNSVSRELVCAQLDQINEDFRAMNDDVHATQFAGDVGDAMVQFQLATVDPEGYPTNGILDWTFGNPTYSMADFENTIKGCTQWDPNRYLNFWIAPLTGGLLGYAQFPQSYFGSNPATDGVVCTSFSVGSTDCPNPAGGQFNLGRTATHEIGHYLGLFHIWGDDGGACVPGGGQDDGIGDTPVQAGDTFGCPDMTGATVISSCGSPDMYMNFMDYTDDACMNMFSNGQAAVIQNILLTDRVSLNATPRTCPPIISLTIVDESCAGANDGAIIVNSNLSDGCQEFSIGGAFQTSPVFTNVACGDYTVTARARKEENCTTSMPATVATFVESAPAPATVDVTCSPPDLTVACPACKAECPFNPSTMTITVNVQGTHAFPGDLAYELTGPNGVTIPLASFNSRCYGTATMFDVTFTNAAGGYFNTVDIAAGDVTGTYNESYGFPLDFAEFAGADIYGDWIVGIRDCWMADQGTFVSYSISITGGCASGATATGNPGSLIGDGTGNPSSVGAVGNATATTCGTAATATATFVAPAAPGVTVEWYDAATGGTQVGTGTTFTPTTVINPNDSGSETYYAQCVCDGCDSKRTAVSYNYNCPVPVELLNFDGKAVAQTVVLDWSTASELNNSHFEIERSFDGNKFTQLGKVTGNGTTITPQAYNFTDITPKTGLNYYRLKQVDFDGTYEYSDVVVIEFNTAKVLTEIYPSPANDFLTVKAGTAINNIKVYDITGKVVLATQLDEATLTQLNVSELLAGTYFVNIELANGKKDILRFVKN